MLESLTRWSFFERLGFAGSVAWGDVFTDAADPVHAGAAVEFAVGEVTVLAAREQFFGLDHPAVVGIDENHIGRFIDLQSASFDTEDFGRCGGELIDRL